MLGGPLCDMFPERPHLGQTVVRLRNKEWEFSTDLGFTLSTAFVIFQFIPRILGLNVQPSIFFAAGLKSFFCCLWTTPGNPPALLLTLYSRIIPVDVQETLWDAQD